MKTYSWEPLASAFRLPNHPVEIKKEELVAGDLNTWDEHKFIEYQDILKAWNEADVLFNDYEIKFFEDCYKKGTKEKKSLFKTTLEVLYAERKEIVVRKARLRSQAGGGVLRWGGKRAFDAW